MAKHVKPFPLALIQSHPISAQFARLYLPILALHMAARLLAVDVASAPPVAAYSFQEGKAEDEAVIFTPAGFDQAGVPKVADAATAGTVTLRVLDSATGQPTFCRVNVVGPDGHFYEPDEGPLKIHSLTGTWPQWPKAWGNRPGKAPFRYFGRFFYCDGKATVKVPPGMVRVEVWKGFEYRPATQTVAVVAGGTQQVEVRLQHSVPMPELGYWSGDPHVHLPRKDDTDEGRIFDLIEAEDIRFGSMLAYNEPAGRYVGRMEKQDSPQFRKLGAASIAVRGGYSIFSAQEYRSSTLGHLNLYGLDALVLPGKTVNTNEGPAYGLVGREARARGGAAIHAHGGYAQEIYADVVQGDVDGVELLQFGVYRGIGLNDWYHMLNCGFKVAATGSSDYPACRKLGDCITYVHSDTRPDFTGWVKGLSQGRSFITTGPLLLLEVDGQKPGDTITKRGDGSHQVKARLRVWSEVAPVTTIQIVANGRMIKEVTLPAAQSTGCWLEVEENIELKESAWIAARAFSLSQRGRPDAEAHTNPVRVIVNDRPIYDAASLEVLLAKLEGQIAVQKKRTFAALPEILAYYERSRQILLEMRAAHGQAAAPAAALDTAAIAHSEEELREFLKPIPAKPMAEVLRSFETVDGFQMQPVATEPLVVDPISAAFDENGNLYVTEMRDYPYFPGEGRKPTGTVRLLRDTNGDGVFDESHVFAEGLLWAGGVVPWKGGVFVAATPDIWYLKDTDGDFKADVRVKVFTGFGTANQQAMVNNLQFGLDHLIYGATGSNGGTVRRGDQPESAGIPTAGRDFRFHPVSRAFELTTGTIQFGTSFDDWGNRFLCNQATVAFHAVLPQHYFKRNPFASSPSAVIPIVATPTPVFRSSPPERWREIRSGRRITTGASSKMYGVSQEVIDGTAGTTVYRGAAYPEKYRGNLFAGEAQHNLIHRRVLEPDGVTFKSRRADEGTEFVRSSDNWFRPVNFVNAPDGTLYVLDMSREIIESIHIPLDVVKHLDLASGRDKGRIYRIAPPGFTYPGPPNLGKADTGQLVAALENPNGWWRDTAHRLIFERQDQAAIAPLRKLLAESSLPQARLHALWSLHGLGALMPDDVVRALLDAHPSVQEHAIALAEPFLETHEGIRDQVAAFAESPQPRLRLQAAFSLGESRHPTAIAALSKLARSGAGDQWLRAAVLSSVSETALPLFADLIGDAAFRQEATAPATLIPIASMIGARNRAGEAAQALDLIARHDPLPAVPGFNGQVLLALGEGLQRGGNPLPAAGLSAHAAAWLTARLRASGETAHDAKAASARRLESIKLLSFAATPPARDALVRLMDVRQPDEIQSAAIRALAAAPAPEVGGILLAAWPRYSPVVRGTVIEVLLSRDDLTRQFFEAASQGSASVAQVDATRRSLLLKHRDPSIRALAGKLFGGDASGDRAKVIAAYAKAMQNLSGDAVRGAQVFSQSCMACHQLGKIGQPVGPDLSALPSFETGVLLVHILDPNRYVPPNFETYLITDTSGGTHVGMIAEQSATDIRLRLPTGATETLLRGNIATMNSTGLSLMPVGLEAAIPPQQMADLFAHLRASAKTTRAAKPKLDIGTNPRLIEPGAK
jgi:putative membrane-bound dehydrogenase-like protein